MKDNFYIVGKHLFMLPTLKPQGSSEENNEYYQRKKGIIEEANLLSAKKIVFRDIYKEEIEKSINNIQQVVFEVTEKCNLNCVYCTYGELYTGNEERQKSKRSLKKEDAVKLLEYLYPVWKEREQKGVSQQIMIGFYGGEPLLNFPLIEKIVQWAKKNTTSLLTFRFHFTTNGLLLDKYIEFVVRNDFIINISFDGNEENMSYRLDHNGENCFKQVYSNVMKVKQNYQDYFEKNVFFIAVLHNKNSLEQACSFCMSHFNKVPLCSRLNDSGVNPQKREIFSEIKESASIELSANTKKAILRRGLGFKEIINFIRYYSGFHFYDYNELLFQKEEPEEKKIPTGVCFPFSKKIYMTINGNLYPCERLDSCFILGNIHNAKVLDTEQIASLYNQYFSNILPVCKNCMRKFSCDKCLFCIDGIQVPQPYCSSAMDKEKFNEMVSNMVATCRKHPDLYRRIMKRTILG